MAKCGKTYAIFSARYAPFVGGVESFTIRISHELIEQGNRVIVVTSKLDDSPYVEVQPDGVEVYRLPSFSLLNARLPISRKNRKYKSLWNELLNKGIDRVLINTRFYRHSLEGLRFARKLDIPVVVLDHGSAHLTLGNTLIDRFVEWYEHLITARVKQFKPIFAGISKASAEWLRHFGITTDLIIPNAIDCDAFREQATAENFKRTLNVRENQYLITFVGRLEPEKGALEFARAAKFLGSKYICVMAGEGSLKKEIEEENIPNLYVLGGIDHPNLSALLRDSAIFCLPSRSEGFCTSLLEAAAWGVVPVITLVGGVEEIIKDNAGLFGVVLENSDPKTIVQSIKEAIGLLEWAPEALAERVQSECSWQASVQKLANCFQD